jgi:hypothetical protein
MRTRIAPYSYGLAARARRIYNDVACSGGQGVRSSRRRATTGGHEARTPRHSGLVYSSLCRPSRLRRPVCFIGTSRNHEHDVDDCGRFRAHRTFFRLRARKRRWHLIGQACGEGLLIRRLPVSGFRLVLRLFSSFEARTSAPAISRDHKNRYDSTAL